MRLEEKHTHATRTAAAREASIQHELASLRAEALPRLPPAPQAGAPPAASAEACTDSDPGGGGGGGGGGDGRAPRRRAARAEAGGASQPEPASSSAVRGGGSRSLGASLDITAARGGGGGGGGGAGEQAAAEARAELAEASEQLRLREHEVAELGAELAEARGLLAEARTDLTREEQAVARKDALLQELQSGGSGRRGGSGDLGRSLGASSDALGASSGIDEVAQARLASGEGRSARLAALAQETVRSLQAKTRRQEEAIERYKQLLADSREALQREKAAAAAQLDGMSEKLYQRQEDDMRKLQEALGRVDAAAEPKTEGTDLSGAEIEGLLLEKDELISQLEITLESGQRELEASKLHLQQRVVQLDTLSAQLEQEKLNKPSAGMQQMVGQLKAKVKSREAELGRMREVIAQLKRTPPPPLPLPLPLIPTPTPNPNPNPHPYHTPTPRPSPGDRAAQGGHGAHGDRERRAHDARQRARGARRRQDGRARVGGAAARPHGPAAGAAAGADRRGARP